MRVYHEIRLDHETDSAAVGKVNTGSRTLQHESQTLQFLEARHRVHAQVEDRIRHAKDSGLGRFPSREFSINQTWLTLTMIAADLVAWLKMLALDGDLAKAEPKAGIGCCTSRPDWFTAPGGDGCLRKTWPWVEHLVAAFARIAAIPPSH